MKKLNQHSTRIFMEILQKLGNANYWKGHVEGFMPLTVERIHENIKTPYGIATQYAVMHYYTQNGDLMRDPEMTFLVIDNRTGPKDWLGMAIYPVSYQLDSLGTYEESIKIRSSQVLVYSPTYLRAHCRFANVWLQNIKAQGFLQ